MTKPPVVSVTDELISEIERDAVVKAKACAPLDTLRLIKEICRLRAEVEALLVDAGRYRWLRENWFHIYGESMGDRGIRISIGPVWNHAANAGHVDAAIDAAMQS
jgi:hypothetical protein